MLPLAYFGIESSGLTLVIDLLIVFLVVLYLSLIYWTYTDARRRIEDPMLVGCATAASLFPFVGTIIYLVLRPPEYLEDVRERDLETQAIEARLEDVDRGLCPHCDYRIEREFVVCPACLHKLKERCAGCQRPLERDWAVCPYCETEVPGAVPIRRRRRRRERDQDSLLIESHSPRERSRPFDSESDAQEDDPTIARAATPAGRAARERAGTATPFAASERAPSRSAGGAPSRPDQRSNPRP
jgi:RNA polymerase subunit RPABC4/transcription elongation factor Spt4